MGIGSSLSQEKKEDLLIFSNGPGEVSTWVQPFVEAVRKSEDLSKKYRIILIIHPDQFASGKEHTVAKSFEGIDLVIGPKEYIKILFTGWGKNKYGFKKKGIIFSLGGNLMHPVLFRIRIRGKHTLYAYTHNHGWERHYENIFVRNDYVKNKIFNRGVTDQKIKVIGDLVYSSMKFLLKREEVRRKLNLSEDERMVVFMPGSRDFEVTYMLPVFLKVIDDITDRLKNVKPFFLKSPYIPGDLIKKALLKGGKIKEAESITGTMVERNIGWAIRFSGGKEVVLLEEGLEYWGEGVDFAVTLPGTNTIQLAYRGIPALVVTPLNKLEVIPVEGIIGLLKWFPVIGKGILKGAVLRYLKRFPYAALPNIYENEEIFPELFGVIKTEDIMKRVLEILKNYGYKRIKQKLKRFNLNHDPVSLILKEIWESKTEN